MGDPFYRVLEAAIDHLQRLKADGVRYVAVSAETLANLTKPVPRPARPRPEGSPSAPSAPYAPVSSPIVPKVSIPEPLAPERPSVPVLAEASPRQAGPAAKLGTELPKQDDREALMAELRARALACQKCPHLAATRQNVVFGVGDIRSPLMFVGEAPGADEDAKGEPFVGAAGQLLTKIIQTMGFSREKVYIANVLKCRPDTPGQTSGNRKPSAEEMKTCLPYLLEQIDLIQPKVIVALGATAVEGLLGLTTPIGKLRGSFQTIRGIPVMATYHPAYLLRNQALSEKRKLWEDMLQVLEKLGLPITEKQRGYFSKG